MSRISFRAAASLALAFSLFLQAPLSRAGLDLEVIAQSGDVLPGAADAQLLDFSGFSASEEGHFLFKAQLAGPDEAELEGLWVGSKTETWALEKLALQGELTSLPGLTAERFASLGSFSINGSGQAAYEARLDTVGGTVYWWNQDVIAQTSLDDPSSQTIVVRQHSPAPHGREADGTPIYAGPDGATSNRIFGDAVMGSEGWVSYTGIVGTFPLTTASFKRSGVWYRTPDMPSHATPELLIAEGMSYAVGEETVVITHVSPLRRKGDRAILLASHVGDDGESGQGFWSLSADGAIEPVLLTGQEAEGTSGKRYEDLGQPHLNALGEAVFSASLTDADSSTTWEGIWTLGAEGLSLVTITSEPAGETLPTFEQLADPQIDEAGNVSFIARWTDEATGTPCQGIFMAMADGGLLSLVSVHDPVPHSSRGESFSSFSRPFFARPGELAFGASTKGPESSGSGCWYATADGAIHALVQQGDRLPLGSDAPFREVTSLLLHGADQDGNLLLEVELDADATALLAAVMTADDPGQPSYVFGGLDQVYDGMAKEIDLTPDPAGLAVTVTYDGLSAVPISAGDYAVQATVWDGHRRLAIVEDTLTIAKADQSLQLSAPPGAVAFGDPSFDLAPRSSSGLPVLVEVLSGPARLADGIITWAGSGFVSLRATQPGDANHEPTVPVLIEVTVLPPAEQRVAVNEGETVGLPLLAGFPEDFVYSPGKEPDHGLLEGSGRETVYRPEPGFGGEDRFGYVASDPVTGAQTEVPVAVTVDRTAGLLRIVLNTGKGGWRLLGEDRFTSGPSTERYVPGGAYEIEFQTIPGFESPQPMSTVIEIGEETVLQAFYNEVLAHPFHGWLGEVFTEAQLEDPAVSNIDADFDRDGFTTWMEFALNLNPLQADRLTFSTDPSSEDLPHIRFLGAEEAPESMEVTFARRQDHAAWQIYYEIAFTSNLVDWIPGVEKTTESIDENWEKVTVRSPAAPGLIASRMLARIAVIDSRDAGIVEPAP